MAANGCQAVPALDLSGLRTAYASGSWTPSTLLKALYPRLEAAHPAIFIHLEPLDRLLAKAAALEALPAAQRGPLWGVPCAAKDNVDVGGMPTTAACPAFSYTPSSSAVGVQPVEAAGAIVVGKTNMDQFAAGLVGTRSPYGAVPTPFDPRFISGGSSSGSGAAVGTGLVSFAFGTDTAGSGRVPAGFCGCVGIKGTVGSVSTVGVVPACASLDCLTVFARTVEDGAAVMRLMRSGQAAPGADVWRRVPPSPITPQLPAVGFRFAVPQLTAADWRSPGGPAVAASHGAAFEAAAARMTALGGVRVDDLDFTPLYNIAAMLYGTAFVAERFSGIRAFLEAKPETKANQGAVGGDDRLFGVTRAIVAGAGKFTAADVFDANVQLAKLRAAALAELDKADLLLVPTALAHYTIAEVQAEEDVPAPKWTQNANLGRFTNFVNLLDMCGASVPSSVVQQDADGIVAAAEAAVAAGELSEADAAPVRARAAQLKETGSPKATLPFGVTLLTRGWRDEWLWGIAAAMHRASGLGCGPAV